MRLETSRAQAKGLAALGEPASASILMSVLSLRLPAGEAAGYRAGELLAATYNLTYPTANEKVRTP